MVTAAGNNICNEDIVLEYLDTLVTRLDIDKYELLEIIGADIGTSSLHDFKSDEDVILYFKTKI